MSSYSGVLVYKVRAIGARELGASWRIDDFEIIIVNREDSCIKDKHRLAGTQRK